VLPFPKIGPEIIKIGPISVRWYGVMYLAGFVASYFLIARQRRAQELGLRGGPLQDLIIYLAMGLIIGARLGYILFYQFPNFEIYVHNPFEIAAIWHGGMSFHGGLIGTMLAGLLFCRRRSLPYWKVGDTVIVTAPVGLFLGRLGNFVNGELFGRPSSLPWAMVFPNGGSVPRHPSQLYEAVLEGVVLFLILWQLKDRGFRSGSMVCLFLGGYGILRFFAEFFREPDPQLGFVLGVFTMGQVFCTLMIIAAIILWLLLPKSAGPKIYNSNGKGGTNG